MSLLHRIISLVLMLMFSVFAVLQINDPDPGIWISAYLFAAIIALSVALNRKYRLITVIAALVYLIWGILIWPEEYNGLTLEKGFTPSIEEARESLGLAICFLSMIYFLVLAKYRSKTIK